jgi:glyoxylase-like metal-dependent hydrolase (beta-lactamase superfamily II)
VLSNGVRLFTGAGCNVLVASTADGLLMVDGGLAGNSDALLAAIARETGVQQVRLLVNTHWHADHTGSNETIGRRGATIVAHPNTRRWLSSRVYREQQDRVYLPRPAEALPVRTIARPETLVTGATRIDVGPLPPAHTNGDLYVFLPEANVLMVGDVLTVGRYPVMDYSTGGWIGGSSTQPRRSSKSRTSARASFRAWACSVKGGTQAEMEGDDRQRSRLTMIRESKGLQGSFRDADPGVRREVGCERRVSRVDLRGPRASHPRTRPRAVRRATVDQMTTIRCSEICSTKVPPHQRG